MGLTMVANTVISGFEIELELELKPNQISQRRKQGWASINIGNEYDLENNSENINSVFVGDL
jgi:hypothetical protein